jgi:hypothetical protein
MLKYTKSDELPESLVVQIASLLNFFLNRFQNGNGLKPVISKMENTLSFTSSLGVVYKTKLLVDSNSLSIMVFV